MNAFGATPTAEVATEGTHGFDMMMLAVMGEHELINRLVDDCKRYDELVAQNKQQQIAKLEDKLDELIEASRNLKANVAKFHHATFSAMQEQASAESEMRNADSALARLHWSLNNNKSLKTRAEVAEQERLLEEAKRRAYNASFAHSTATKAYNMALQMENEANAAAANANAEARGLDAQLRQSKGEKHVCGTGGFFIS